MEILRLDLYLYVRVYMFPPLQFKCKCYCERSLKLKSLIIIFFVQVCKYFVFVNKILIP
jgi:hypothetical protein